MSMTVCVVVLRDQMFNRQLKEVLQIGDKELLRAVIVRYEDSKPPSDRQKNDVADEKDDGFQESKELLKTIDYYYHSKIPYHHRICYQNSSGGSTQGLERAKPPPNHEKKRIYSSEIPKVVRAVPLLK